MNFDDLFENNVIPFPSRKVPEPEPETTRSDINYEVVDKIKELHQNSIDRQRYLALPTVMSGQPKGIKPVVAWAVALDEISKINDKNKIQQWIFDKGLEIIDTLLELNKQDLNDYKQIDQIPMKFWQVGKTRAIVYRHKQVDLHAQDTLQNFKAKYLDNVSENNVTITSATKNGKINQKLADKITDPHGYFHKK